MCFKKKPLVITVIFALTFLISSVLAYNLLGGRWSESDIGNLGIYVNPYNNPHYSEILAAESSWDSTQTPLNSYTTTYEWQAEVFAMLVDKDDEFWDGYTMIYPSASSNPYSQAVTQLNMYYTQYYSFEKTQSVQAHEFGHVLGLAHESGSVLMNPVTSTRYDTYGVFTPQQDDIDGVNEIYG